MKLGMVGLGRMGVLLDSQDLWGGAHLLPRGRLAATWWGSWRLPGPCG